MGIRDINGFLSCEAEYICIDPFYNYFLLFYDEARTHL